MLKIILASLFIPLWLHSVEPTSLPAPYTPSADNQLLTLGASKTPRFVLQEMTWPTEPGKAEICLWQDDKYAACSITIDDNNKPDHAWWLNICAKHGIKVTFFIITGGIDGQNKGYNGTWDDWRAIRSAGHDVQSHSITHGSSDDTAPPEKITLEYAGSKQAIESNLSGHRCLTLAYPYGKGQPNLAAGYYIAVRGTTGTPSAANQINYLNTSLGSLDPDQINAILGRPATVIKWLNNPSFRRGWIQPLYHLVAHGTTAEEKQANVAQVEAQIANLIAQRELIWIDTFTTVAKYGQERDSATLTTTARTLERIELALTDRMRDDVFDQALTLKVRVLDEWKSVTASQNNSTLPVRLVQHEGHSYALVQAVPDRGAIVLKP
ncbi:MAG: polysaccharide deacetylase family protein [Planctomycetota bacterium]